MSDPGASQSGDGPSSSNRAQTISRESNRSNAGFRIQLSPWDGDETTYDNENIFHNDPFFASVAEMQMDMPMEDFEEYPMDSSSTMALQPSPDLPTMQAQNTPQPASNFAVSRTSASTKWTEQEDELLLEIWPEDLSNEDKALEFHQRSHSNRTFRAMENKYNRLHKSRLPGGSRHRYTPQEEETLRESMNMPFQPFKNKVLRFNALESVRNGPAMQRKYDYMVEDSQAPPIAFPPGLAKTMAVVWPDREQSLEERTIRITQHYGHTFQPMTSYNTIFI